MAPKLNSRQVIIFLRERDTEMNHNIFGYQRDEFIRKRFFFLRYLLQRNLR